MRAMKPWPQDSYHEQLRRRENVRLILRLKEIENRHSVDLEGFERASVERSKIKASKNRWLHQVKREENNKIAQQNINLQMNLLKIQMGQLRADKGDYWNMKGKSKSSLKLPKLAESPYLRNNDSVKSITNKVMRIQNCYVSDEQEWK